VNRPYVGPEPDVQTLRVLRGLALHEVQFREGHQLLVSVMNWVVIDCPHKALELIGTGDNCNKIACALTAFFHGADQCGHNTRKELGYDQLRRMVKNLVVAMQEDDYGPWPTNYQRLANRIFIGRGLKDPRFEI
jgi:hypothetical protein